MGSEDYEPKMWTSCEDPEECPCDFCREFRADRAFGMLRDERDQLRAQVEDAERYEHADGDGTDRLVRAIHGRKPKGRDYIGGSQANMLHEGADLIEKLRARVAELEGERTWRPIATAPRDGTHVLAFARLSEGRSYSRLIARYNGEWNGWETIIGRWSCVPSHWQPLPAGPEVQDAQ